MRATGPALRAALAALVLLGAVPALMFLLLIMAGDLHLHAGLIGIAVSAAAALLLAVLLSRDVAALTVLMRAQRSDQGDPIEPIALFTPGLRRLGHEVVRLMRTERRRRAQLERIAAADRSLLDRLPDPLFLLDSSRFVVWCNPSAEAAFGSETASLLRHPLLRAALAEAESSALPVRASLSLASPLARDLDAVMVKVGAPDDPVRLFLWLADRSRERGLERMRADFVANASHELRTPLASLIGFIDTLRGPAADDPEAQHRFLGIMAEQAARMQAVIGDLLSLSRIEMTEHQPPETILFLPPVLERVAAAMEPMLTGNQTRLLTCIAEDLPRVTADAEQLAQLFSNLLDNAIKYGGKGGTIQLDARLVTDDSRFESPGIMVSVADDGPGIARQHLPRLTERFYRVDKGRSRAVGGTGLGLAIVKHVVARHRGRLLIDSIEGEGTIFSVWLPLARGENIKPIVQSNETMLPQLQMKVARKG